ncbi:MAG TPA: hypothetical protein VLW50_09115 [Streptosporangiaceae bacterium]|nr:hypothetical protein [Streptosporangiaceae bacterium]
MGLTSGLLIGLAGFFAATAFAGTLWMWRRLASPRPSHLLARIGLLLWAQVTVMLVIFLSVNKSFGFFASWPDLFGTNNTTGVIVAPHHQSGGQSAPIRTRGTGALASRTATGRSGPTWSLTTGHDWSRYGRLQLVRITGLRSGIVASAYIYLPPQSFSPAQAGRTFPVIVVISDHVTTAGDPYSAVSLAVTAAAEIDAGRARPAIYVMVGASAAGGTGRAGGIGEGTGGARGAGRDLGCLDVPGGPQAATFFAQDLPTAIESAYPATQAPAGWAVLGDASGSYCALSLAMAHSDRFAVAAAPLAGYGAPPGSAGTRPGTAGWWLSGGSPLIRQENDLSWRLVNLPPQPISLFFLRAGQGEPRVRSGDDATGTPAPARAFLSPVRFPTHVTQITLATGPRPLAPALDRIMAAVTAPAPGSAPTVP